MLAIYCGEVPMHIYVSLVSFVSSTYLHTSMSKFLQDLELVEDDDDHHQQQQFDTAALIMHGTPNFTAAAAADASTLNKKKKRNLPGNPDPDAEVVALSPRTLMATNRYICEVCHKGFQRDQNLQLHRRGHNLPWKLKQRASNIVVKKRVYVCPEPTCVHHEPSRALGDLTGIKKHFCRKHGEKKWKCDKCSKRYAVQSDWKAHAKICGTREYHCDCGTIFSRKDSFVTHRAFCDALTEENCYKLNLKAGTTGGLSQSPQELCPNPTTMMRTSSHYDGSGLSHIPNDFDAPITFNNDQGTTIRPGFSSPVVGPREPMAAAAAAYNSATALLQKAAEMGAKVSDNSHNTAPVLLRGFAGYNSVHQLTDNNCNTSIATGLHPTSPARFGGIITTSTHDHMHSSKAPSLLDRQVFMGSGETATVDFLGVEPGKMRDVYNENTAALAPYLNQKYMSLHQQQ